MTIERIPDTDAADESLSTGKPRRDAGAMLYFWERRDAGSWALTEPRALWYTGRGGSAAL